MLPINCLQLQALQQAGLLSLCLVLLLNTRINIVYGSVATDVMNSLANLNAVVDVQGDSSSWPSDQGWDPPVATICTGSLTDNRLHFHHSSAAPRQEWDWSDSHMLLASQYAAEEHENIDCKPSILQVEALGGAGAGGSGAGLRQYSSGILSAANMSPTIGGGGAQSSWPGLLNAVPLRQHMGLESSTGSCYSSLYGGGGMGLGGGGSGTGLSSYYTHQSPLLGLASEQRRLHDILKRGMYSASAEGGSPDFTSGRLGLNLGGRTYFSANDNNMLARFHVTGKRFRPNSPSLHVPLCQAEGCTSDLSMAKHYHRRHKVCEYHSKAATVIITGNTQRFCQQCSRFHALTEFDEGKRSCRKRLADHNRRRRKPQPAAPAPPAPNSGTSPNLQPTPGTDNPASNQNEDQDTNAGARSQSDQQGAQQVSKEGTAGSTSSPEPIAKSSLLSPMTLAPSVSLTLQNGSREKQSNPSSMQVSSQDNNNKEKDAAYESQAAPFLLNGPSLSLSSNIATAAGSLVGGDSVATSNHPSPAHAPHSFNEVELSVPWLRAHHAGSSSRINLMQKSLGKLSTTSHEGEEGSMVYNTVSSCRRNENGQFINEHGHMFAEHMHNLQSQAGSVGVCDNNHHHHHQGRKTENWMLENAVAQEGQIVLSLLETASSKKEHNYNNHQSGFNAHEQAHERHPLGFLQHHHHHAGGLHLNSASPSDMDHEASDAALSLHCMQVLRPLNESLYTTADFMKDGFV